MGFGVDLQGRESHDALVRVQDAEIRMLEIMKRFLTARIESDRQYAASLTKMVAHVHKGDSSELTEFQECCNVFQAWDSVVKETECFVKQMRDNADTLQSRTLDSLNFLITEKKNARRGYMEQRNNLDLQLAKHQEDVNKSKAEYARLMERLKVDRAKYYDLQSKGKAGSKLEDAKMRYVRTMNRLHQQHNDYVLAIEGATGYQAEHFSQLLPSTLDCHQRVQELFVRHTKYVLHDMCQLTDFTLEPFQEISKRLYQAVDRIESSSEYGSAFIVKYKSEAPPLPVFEFDQNIMDDYVGSLKSSQIILDDLTFESLQHRRTRCQEELKAEQKALESHTSQLQDLTATTTSLEQRLQEEETAETMKELVEKGKQQEQGKREVTEKKASIQCREQLLSLIQQPLTQLGDASPPSAFESGDMSDVTLETESNLSASSRDGGKKTFKFPHVNPFKKDKSNGKLKSSRDDLDSEDADVRPKTANGSNQVGSYEQTDPPGLGVTPNGPSRVSMAAMREEGKILTNTLPVPKQRMEDEEWFHGVLPREEVQRLLTEDGDYLVRESKNRKTNETQYVLSVYWQGHKHFIIQGAEETGWRFEGSSYPTIQELLRQQHASGQPVTNKSQAILKKAILREDWELLNDHIHLEMKIGNGNFGEVYKGLYTPKNMVVAVKTCRDTLSEDQRKKFLMEGRILKQYNHPNIVSFIGIAAQRQPVMIVMEFVPGGALLQFLRKQGKLQSRRQLTQMCVDAANGMAYLENKNCIHRDLAARNCLVGESSVIKISDFGMSREEEEYTVSEGMKQIPIKWTAPEALNFGKYTSMCDVWSYGILMWEIFSGGQQPYPGMSNTQAREKIEEGYRLHQLPQQPDNVYQLMLRCWEYNPDRRPRFKEIYEKLKDIVRRL